LTQPSAPRISWGCFRHGGSTTTPPRCQAAVSSCFWCATASLHDKSQRSNGRRGRMRLWSSNTAHYSARRRQRRRCRSVGRDVTARAAQGPRRVMRGVKSISSLALPRICGLVIRPFDARSNLQRPPPLFRSADRSSETVNGLESKGKVFPRRLLSSVPGIRLCAGVIVAEGHKAL
jgi:hypothetical protein